MATNLVGFAERDLGITLTDGQRDTLAAFEQGGYSTAVWRMGRRSGKSLMSDILVLYDAVVRDRLRERMRPDEPRISAVVCPRLDQAAEHIRSCRALIDNSRRLRRLVVSQTSERLALANGSEIRAYPCSARSIRGGAWSSCVLDELAHFVDTESGNAAGDRILEAATPSLAQFGSDGWLVCISTPMWKQGAFHRLDGQASSGRFAYMHHRHASTLTMNSAIDAAWLEQRRREDPESFAREFEARFLDGVSGFLSGADVVACVERGVRVRQPVEGVAYEAAVDPAYSLDAFALVIGHRERERTAIDGCWVWRKGGHEATLDQIAGICSVYAVRTVTTDQGCAVPVREGIERRGLMARYAPWTNETKYRAFSALKIACNSRGIVLPDDPGLIEELCALEARPTPSGMTRIAAASGAHDDRATALAALVEALSGRGRPVFLGTDDVPRRRTVPGSPEPPQRRPESVWEVIPGRELSGSGWDVQVITPEERK